MGFFRQEHWNGLPFPPPGNLQDPGIDPMSPASPALAGGFLTTVPLTKSDYWFIRLSTMFYNCLLFSAFILPLPFLPSLVWAFCIRFHFISSLTHILLKKKKIEFSYSLKVHSNIHEEQILFDSTYRRYLGLSISQTQCIGRYQGQGRSGTGETGS